MKAKLMLLGTMTVFLTSATGFSQTTFFDDTFGSGSTVNSATPAPPGTGFTSYEEISGKSWTPTPSVSPNDLQFGIAATSSGSAEIQALFSTNAVTLVAPGDYVQLVIVFTNTSGGLLTAGQGYLGVGLYNSGTGSNYPVPGGLNGTATSSSTTATTANAATWEGYFAQIAYSGYTSAILTRPVQNGPDNNNQDLVTTGSGTYSFSHPTGADVGSTVTSSLILGTNVPYTEILTITLNAIGSETITNSLYAGVGINGTPLSQFGGVAANSTLLTQAFNAIGFGWYQKANTHPNQVDISSITVSGSVTAVTGPPSITSQPSPLVVATNGYGQFTVVPSGFDVTYQWFRNGDPLTDGGDISGAKTSTLTISPAQSQDAFSANNGYYCEITGAEGYSTNSVTNSLTLVPATNLTWTAASSTTWDVATTPNFVDPNNNPQVFIGGDPVVFNDTASDEDITLAGNLGPASVSVTTGQAYTFGGTGSIVGPCSVTFSGTGLPISGEIILNANNVYSGGTLLTNGIYVDLENYNGFGTGPVTFNEAGGEMEVVPAGTASSGIAGNVVVDDDFTILADADSSYGVVFLGDLSGTSGKTLSITQGSQNANTNATRIRAYGTSTVYNANLDLAANILFAPYSSSGSQTYNGVISDAGAFMQKGTITYLNGANTYSGGTTPAQGTIGLGVSSQGNPGSLTSGPIGIGPLLLAPDSTTSLTGNGMIEASAANITIGNAIQYPTGTNNLTLQIGGVNNLTLAGPYTLQGNDAIKTNTITSRNIEVTNTALTTISGLISDGGLGYGLNVSGNGVLELENSETYSGPTTVSNATLLLNGQLAGGGVTVATNGTLSGEGTIGGPVSILNSAHLKAGVQGNGNLTINNSLIFAAGSTNIAEINETGGTYGAVTATSIAYNGTLYATNLGGSLSTGDTFTIFSTPSHTGNFTAIAGSPGPGLAWNFNPTSGVLSVVTGIATNPTNISFSVSGGNLDLSWPSDHLGWLLQVQTNSLAQGIGTNWVTVPNSGSVDSTNIPIVLTNGTVFFRLMYP